MAAVIDFMRVKNQTATSADLYIYGDIIGNSRWERDDSDVMPDDVKNLLSEIEDKSNLNIYVNSGGGEVFSGLAIYNMLKRSKAHKTVYVDGLAASIASVIALAGDRVIMPSNAFLMVHKAWTFTGGDSTDFRKMADDLDRIDGGILNVYKDNLKEGVDIADVQKLVDAETWLNGEEASQYFNIELIEPNDAAACASDYFDKYKKTPDRLVKKALNEPPAPPDNTQHLNDQLKMQNELELLVL